MPEGLQPDPNTGRLFHVLGYPKAGLRMNPSTKALELLNADGSVSGGPLPIVYNAASLASARTAMAAKSAAGQGGFGIVWQGDSINEGGVTGGVNTGTLNDYLFNTAAHLTKIALQAKYNPPSVRGGYGYLRTANGVLGSGWLAAPNQSLIWNPTGTVTPSLSPGEPAESRLIVPFGSSVRFAFDGTLDPSKRMGVTSIEPVYAYYSGLPDLYFDVSSTDAARAGGSGDRATATIHPNVTPPEYGHHHGAAIGLGSLNPTQLNVAQFTAAASGNAFCPGAFAYNGDENCGVHLHQMAHWGTAVNVLAVNTGDQYSDPLIANVDAMSTGTGLPSTRAGLFIFNFITNDEGGNVPISTFKSQYGTVISRCLGRPTSPGVILVIPPCRAASTPALHLPYAQAIYQLADQYGCAVLDLWAAVGYGTYDAVIAMGWGATDGTHYNAAFQQYYAAQMVKLITGS